MFESMEVPRKAAALKELTPVTARGEATRRKLMQAGEEEFGNKGFHAASVSSITTRAGVGQGTFYLYFHSKEEVFSVIVREVGEALRQAVALSRSIAGDGLDTERRALEGFLSFTQAHRGLFRIVQEAQFVDEEAFRDYHEGLAQGYRHVLQHTRTLGEVSAGDCEARAWSMSGIAHFLGMRYCLWQGSLPEPEVLDGVMRMLGRGIAPVGATH